MMKQLAQKTFVFKCGQKGHKKNTACCELISQTKMQQVQMFWGFSIVKALEKRHATKDQSKGENFTFGISK
jgi:hypothetical protein